MAAMLLLGVPLQDSRQLRVQTMEALLVAAIPRRPDVAHFLQLAEGDSKATAAAATMTVEEFKRNLREGRYDG